MLIEREINAAKLAKCAASGKQGHPTLTAEQVKEMSKKLEELAEKLKDEKAMKAYLESLKEAMKHAGAG